MNWGPSAQWPSAGYYVNQAQGVQFGNYNTQDNRYYYSGFQGDWPYDLGAFIQQVSPQVDRSFLDALFTAGHGRTDQVTYALNAYRSIAATEPRAWQMLLHATALNDSPSVVVGVLPAVGRTVFEHDTRYLLRTAFMRPVPEAFEIAWAMRHANVLSQFVQCRTVDELAEYPRIFHHSGNEVLQTVSATKSPAEIARLIKLFLSLDTDLGNHCARVLISCCKVMPYARDLADGLRREGLSKQAKQFDEIWTRRKRQQH